MRLGDAPMPVPRSKAEFYSASSTGALGNAPRTWFSVEAWLASGFAGVVGVRSTQPGGRYCAFLSPAEALAECASRAKGSFVIAEAVDPASCVLQGEVRRSFRGLEVFWSRQQSDLRSALRADGQTSVGLAASALLEVCWPSSLEMLLEIVDLGGVVEFAVFDHTVGQMAHHNTIIWEVRAY